jgi:hypothetical protein
VGLFGRRKADGQQPADRVEWVTSTARRMLAERGVETTVAHGAKPEDVTLIASDTQRYPLYNAIAKTEGASIGEATAIISAHLDGLLEKSPTIAELSADELRERIRTRILDAGPSAPGQPTFEYARPFAEGLIVVLCIDFPKSVSFVSDGSLADLALGLDELYALGQLNTDREPIDERFEPVPGLQAIAGDSLFIASKAANLPAVFGSAPHGTLFAVPHRQLLIALPITGAESVTALNDLVRLTLHIVSRGPHPGGIVSPDVYFSRDHVVERISSIDEEGSVSVVVGERLQRAFEEAGAL